MICCLVNKSAIVLAYLNPTCFVVLLVYIQCTGMSSQKYLCLNECKVRMWMCVNANMSGCLTDGGTYVQKDARTKGRTDGGRLVGRTDGPQTKGRTNGRIDGRTDEQTNIKHVMYVLARHSLFRCRFPLKALFRSFVDQGVSVIRNSAKITAFEDHALRLSSIQGMSPGRYECMYVRMWCARASGLFSVHYF